jgi:P-type E1-E2 ATPase
LAGEIAEVPGSGVQGKYSGHDIAVGSAEFIAGVASLEPNRIPAGDGGKLRSYVTIDGRLAGYFTFYDELRPDLPELFQELERNGVLHLAVLSGDDEETVQQIAQLLGVTDAHGELSPSGKVDHVERIQKEYGCTVVIGDGTNDAPALATADVGIAVTGGRGGVAAETADIILLGSDLTKIGVAAGIARRTMRIAKQSIVVGLSLSVAAMALAAAGYIQPIAGALYQEAVDLGVIINALRAARPASG